MRRIAPWLPIVTALATASVVAACSSTTPWAFSVAVWPFATPYIIPMFLLALATGVRRRSAAPPWMWQVALALALPALVLVVLAPLFIVAQRVFHFTIAEDYGAASFYVWAASIAATALWVLFAACRWVWWPRPVPALGMPPYRLALAAPPREVPRASRTRLHGARSGVAICLVSVGLVACLYALWEPQPDWHSDWYPTAAVDHGTAAVPY